MDFELDKNFRKNLETHLSGQLEKACESLVTYIKTVTLSKGRRGQGDFLGEGQPPYAWSGSGRNSVMQRQKEGDKLVRQVGSPLFYMRVQEMGANIHGTHGLLTIPRTDEAIRHLKGGGTTRSFPRPLTLIPSRTRPGVFFLIEAKRRGSRNAARTLIHFVLARNVRLLPRSWLASSVQAHQGTMSNILVA